MFNVPVKSNLRWWPLAAVLAVFLVNLPLGHAAWNDRRLHDSAVSTDVEVLDTAVVGASSDDPRYFVTWRFNPDEGGRYTSQVTPRAFRIAEDARILEVEYLPDEPEVNRPVERPDTGNMGLVITIGGNATIAVMVGLMLWVRRATRFELLATSDVVRCKPPELLREDGDEVVVRGEVAEVHDDHVVMTCGGRRITVILGEHVNPIGHQQYAEARGRRVR